jgi:hypothetical protein
MSTMSTIAARALLAKVSRRIEGPLDLLLVIRMLGWACAVRMLKHRVPLPRLVRLARWDGPILARPNGQEKVVTLARWASRAMQWSSRGNCLVRGLITYRYLMALDARPTLVVGLAIGAPGGDVVHGHVWVTVQGRPVGETTEALSVFHPVLAFTPDGRHTPDRPMSR